MTLAILVSTYPDMDIAKAQARHIIDSKLAACANMTQTSSVYRWKGKVCQGDEVLVIFKTSNNRVAQLHDAILKGHPYDVPEILEIDAKSSGVYMDWITESVS